MHPIVNRGKVTPDIIACGSIIRSLFSRRYKSLAWIFYEPINAMELGLFDYHEIVKQPMDLSTVRTRLNMNYYSNAVDFAYDVRLIFYNAYLYTSPGHLCYNMAKQLQLIFEEMFANVPLGNCAESYKWSESSSADSCASEDTDAASNCSSISTMSGFAYAMEDEQLQVSEVWRRVIDELPLTPEEDLELRLRVGQLDGTMLLNVIHMIHQLEGTHFGYANMELEVDMANLTTITKRAIFDYMTSNGITGKRISRGTKNNY